MLRIPVSLAAVVAAGTLGCACPTVDVSGAANKSAKAFAGQLAHSVTIDAMMGHLAALQAIADANGGNRAFTTPGYQASVDYVIKALRSKGFDVFDPELDIKQAYAQKPNLTVGGTPVAAKALDYTAGTPGINAPLVPVLAGKGQGCDSADYDGLPITGAVALVDRGTCSFAVKEAAAAARGARALVVADNVDNVDRARGGTLGAKTAVQIPSVFITKADGATLRANPGPVALKLDAGVRIIHTRNVIAQTKTGSAHDVVMIGAHLDSVKAGPGINDDGSGVAAVLETALQLGSSPSVHNALRFAFWDAEELGLVGSTTYVESLDYDALKDIALYLNYDMIASPNAGYFTYDGDQSTALAPGGTAPPMPEGSVGLERTLVEYLSSAGKQAQDTKFDGRSDYEAFAKAGIPSGGLFSGDEENMNEDQARLWGGTAGQPFAPHYHQASDTLACINRTALEILGRGVAFSAGLYAQDLGGRNGMPIRQDRTRYVVPPS